MGKGKSTVDSLQLKVKPKIGNGEEFNTEGTESTERHREERGKEREREEEEKDNAETLRTLRFAERNRETTPDFYAWAMWGAAFPRLRSG